jgi:hypothetical protein
VADIVQQHQQEWSTDRVLCIIHQPIVQLQHLQRIIMVRHLRLTTIIMHLLRYTITTIQHQCITIVLHR